MHGSQEFVISIAQQISWLAAACHDKLSQLSNAYVGFNLVENSSTYTHATFKVDVKTRPCPLQTQKGCWNTLVGPGVIISGFPIPERQGDERGLEIKVGAMAALAKISEAVSFEGGFVIKGRCHALVPISLIGQSVQWHMLDSYPLKLDWNDIRRLCPKRLKGHLKSFEGRRSFVGWCPDVLEFIGMCLLVGRFIPTWPL